MYEETSPDGVARGRDCVPSVAVRRTFVKDLSVIPGPYSDSIRAIMG